MAKQSEYADFLSDGGQIIFDAIKENCKKLNLWDADDLEIAMLANSFALYAECASFCNKWGVKMTFKKESNKKTGNIKKDLGIDDSELAQDEIEIKEGGIYEQVRPEYTVMKNEYSNILKHSGKFGLNPGDRERIFKKLSGKKESKKGFDLTGDKMKVA